MLENDVKKVIIDKLTHETNKLLKLQVKVHIYAKINDVINNILNKKIISKEEAEDLEKYLEYEVLEELDEETFKFIVFYAQIKNNFDDTQKNLLVKIQRGLHAESNLIVDKKILRNKKLIEILESNQLLLYIEQFVDTLKEYGYNKEQILVILNTIIRSNDSVVVPAKTELSEEIKNNEQEVKVVDEPNSENIENEEVHEIVEAQKYDDTKILEFFKKNKLFYGNLDEKYKQMLRNPNVDFENASNILQILKKHKLLKKIMQNSIDDFIRLIIYGSAESVEQVINFCAQNHISLDNLIKKYMIFLFGLPDYSMEALKQNLEFLKRHDFDFDHSRKNDLIFRKKGVLKNSYYIASSLYGYPVEYSDELLYMNTPRFYMYADTILESGNSKDMISILSDYLNDESCMPNFMFSLILSGKMDLSSREDFEEFMDNSSEGDCFFQQMLGNKIDDEYDELYEKYYSHLIETRDDFQNLFFMIPNEILIDEKIFENEYIAQLENNYKRGSKLYWIKSNDEECEDIYISRIKVLRFASWCLNNNIELTKEAIIAGIKLNYAFYNNALELINNIFECEGKVKKIYD